MMDQNLGQHDSGKINVMMRNNALHCNGEKSNKCNQCDYASSGAGHLRRHLKTHSGEKPNKCNQCDFASSQVGNLRRHLKTHTGEKSNKSTNVTLHPHMQSI